MNKRMLRPKARSRWGDERGRVLIMVLIVMVMGGLLIPPLLGHMITGLRTTTDVYEKKTHELYASDAGIQDALWQIKNDRLSSLFTNPAYDAYDYVTDNWTYSLSEQINDKDVSVTVSNVWIPQNMAVPDKTQARTIIETGKLRVTGRVSAASTYQIKIAYYKEGTAEDLLVTSMGVWLPPGFAYVDGSSDLEDNPALAYYAVPIIIPHNGGQAVVWTFRPGTHFAGRADLLQEPFPGVDPASVPMESTITFQFVSEEDRTLDALSWIITSGAGDIPFAWDAGTRIFRITSAAGGTAITAHVGTHGNDFLLSNAITSRGDLIIYPTQDPPTVVGDVQYGGDLTTDPATANLGEIIDGNIINEEPEWPAEEGIVEYYLGEVQGSPHYNLGYHPTTWDPIVIDPVLGPVPAIRPSNQVVDSFYYDGNLLFRKQQDADVTINGTIYVDGNLTFGSAIGPYEAHVYLNGQTIFATGDILIENRDYFFHGPGAIIALGTVIFKPSVVGDGFILAMSVNEYVLFEPSGAFYGSVFGNTGGGPFGTAGVVLKPHNLVFYPGPGNINVPKPGGGIRIMTWVIE